MRDPLVAPLAAIAAGILVSRFVLFETRELITAIAVLLALGLLGLWRRARVAAGCCALAGLVFAGALCEVAHRPGPPPVLDAEGLVTIAGCVVEPPVPAAGRERFIVDLERGARAQVTLYPSEGDPAPRLHYGQRVEVDARVRSPRNYLNPGAFDHAGYLARKQIFWTATARGASSVRVLPGECGSRFEGAVAGLRAAALERIAALYPGRPYESAMMQAILIGETFQLEKVWTEHFRRTGTIHALVISGTHVAALAAFFLFLLRICLVPQAWAVLATVVAAWGYSLITGWQAPCVRSAAGLTLYMVGRHFYRERRLMNLLAAVAIGFLVIDPEQMFEASFQLSFLAVAFMGAFAAPILEATTAPLARALSHLGDHDRHLRLLPRAAEFRLEMWLLVKTLRHWLPPGVARVFVTVPATLVFYVFGLAVVSAVVQAGLALPMVTYFHRVGVTGLSANILIVPLMGFVVQLGFVAVLTGWQWVAEFAGVLLGWSRVVVDWHAAMEPNWRVPAPPLWLAVALSAALVAAAMAVRSRRWRACAAAAVFGLLALMFAHPFPADTVRGSLEVTAIDVGQGDSFLLAFPDGKLITLDAGGFPVFRGRRAAGLDTGEDVVSPYLWHRSIRRLDVVALSHVHADHSGGVAALIDNFQPRELWTAAVPDCPDWRAIRERAVRHGVRIVELWRGREFDYGGAHVEVLAPAVEYLPASEPRNSDSLVLRVSYGRHSFLLAGDMERAGEWELLDRIGHADVLKVGHHGSRTSTSEAFLDSVHPAFGLVTLGAENLYGYPHPDVLGRLEDRRIGILRTDSHGLVTFRTDGRRLHVDTARWTGTPGTLYSAF
ncbi:MAG TPA: ComEC/Rec2 family competence protein [Bryobacteraceae bacterium]|nr:ComEC/Rec2 family competence protein [Bryobacteraceae bacterium]